ncbi:MAG: hypothetical protein P8Y69_14450 [Gammaproteobacteria bacterium]
MSNCKEKARGIVFDYSWRRPKLKLPLMAGSSLEEERSAQLVLVNRNSTVLGQLPIVHTKIPFWSEVESIVQEVRRRHGIDVTIVRLLDVERGGFMRGGRVTYLAETDDPIIGTPWDGVLDEQPNRNHYAEVGGARADIAWAEDVLRRRGLTRTGPAVQVRTWNLSSLWRIPAGSDQVWLKAVPPFFAHEGPLIHAMLTRREGWRAGGGHRQRVRAQA